MNDDERRQQLGQLLADLHAERLKTSNLDAFIEGAITRLRSMAVRVIEDDPGVTYKEAALKALETRRKQLSGGADNIDIPTGWRRLDKVIRGLRRGRLVVISAPTGGGKSAFAHNIVEYTASRHQIRSAMFSLEMGYEEIGERTLAHQSIDNPTKLEEFVGRWLDLPVRIFDQPASVFEISDKARKLAAEGLDLIVVDYAQLVRPSGNNTERRERTVAEISYTLKQVARELDIVVIVAAQLNRDNNIRESAAIEQDADLWLELAREDGAEMVDVKIRKNRHGPRENIQLKWIGDTVSFENPEGHNMSGTPVPNQPDDPQF